MECTEIRILVAGGRGAERDGLARLLARADGLAIVATAGSAQELQRAASAHGVDVAVIDLDLPGGADLAGAALRALQPAARFIVYSAGRPPARAAGITRAGASGVADLAAGSAALVALIRRIAGHVSAGREIERAQQRPGPADAAGRTTLTCREREILALIAQGYTNAHVAEATGLSEHTVRAHLRSVARKLGVRNRAHAVSAALQSGEIALGKAS